MYWFSSDLDDFLEMVEESLSSNLETKEEALAKGTGTSFKDKDLYGTYDVFSYRHTDYRPELKHNYKLAQELLPEVKNIIVERIFTPGSVFKIMTLFYCHGYLMPSAFAVDDDMTAGRASKVGNEARNVDAQRKWASHYLLREYKIQGGWGRALDAFQRLVNAILDGNIDLPDGFDISWFEKFLNLKDLKSDNYSKMVRTYRGNLSREKAQELIKRSTNDIPPLDLEIPPPSEG